MATTPYHSADNGFACAAAGRGITEALQEHLNVIVRNEELELEISDSRLQSDIKGLVEDKERLEQQKLDRQESINTSTEEVVELDLQLAELNATLENPLTLNTGAAPASNIDELVKKLEEKKVEKIKRETDLQAPTEAELNDSSIGVSHTSPERKLSIPEWIITGLFIIIALGLVFYLIIFYASVGDRTFTEGIGTNKEKQYPIIPKALFEAWNSSPKDWFVIMFPSIFLTLAFLVHFCHEHKKWWMFSGLLGATFLIDLVIAWKISEQMHEFIKGEDAAYLLGENWVEIATVLFLGFGMSLLLGYALLWIMKMLRGERPYQDKSERLEKQKRHEQNDRLVQLNALVTEIQHLETQVDTLKAKRKSSEERLEETSKQQIRVKVAPLQAKREKLGSKIGLLNQEVDSLQREVNACEDQIEALLKRQHSRGIDLKKLESNAHEFVSGWCRYIAQSKNELSSDISSRIKDIQSLAEETLEAYKASLPTN